jgi:DNA-binding MarR family transcriptional regulator
MDKKTETIYKIREFNRFYTAVIGILNKFYLNSEFSVTEARILFEIADNCVCNANYLVNKLQIDKGYLSRTIKNFKIKGLIEKQISEKDARSFNICLTEKGKTITNELINASNIQIGELLYNLTDEDCNDICKAMEIITKCLSAKNESEDCVL